MTFSPAFASASASWRMAEADGGASAGKQSQNTHRSSTTVRILLQPSPRLWPAGNRKSLPVRERTQTGLPVRERTQTGHIWAQLERNLGKLFYGGA